MATKQLDDAVRNIKSFVAAQTTAEASDAELLGRFVAQRDESAFTALVKRHGRMVLDVALRTLGRDQDAEDVFQATFLLLARKAGSIRKRGSIASWLYGAAYRLARRAREQRAVRRAREATAAKIREPQPRVADAWQELQEVLQDALAHLPERYRTPLVLCYLEGKTQEQAARQLECPLGTARSWLARGRVLLRKRLARRGITLSVSALATALVARAAGAATGKLTTPLVQPIVKAALRFAAGSEASSLVSAEVAGLVNAGLTVMTTAKLKLAAALLIACVLLVAGFGAMTGNILGSKPDAPESQPALGPRAELRAGREHLTDQHADKFQPAENRPDGNDRFGDPLPEGTIARLGTVRFRHGGAVYCVAFSPDSKTLASAGYDHSVRLWDPATGKEIRRFVGHRDLVMDVAFSPDGKKLASASYERDRTVRVWDVATGRQLRSFNDGGGHWGHVAFSPDGKILAGGSSAHSICLWDVEKGKLLHMMDGQERSPVAVCLAFSPDGRILASGGKDGAIRLWDPTSGKELRRFKGTPKKWNHDVVFSPDGRVLASCGTEGKEAMQGKGIIHLWDMATGRELQRVPADEGSSRLSYSSDGKTLGYIGYDNKLQSMVVRRVDATTGKKVQVLPGATGGFAGSWALAPDDRTLAWSVGSAGLRRPRPRLRVAESDVLATRRLHPLPV
jgi:RNA polymerase sigma factor (sigma-70 family)